MEFSFLAETNPDAPALAKLAESYGFGSFFLLDSHVAWREVYPYLTLCVRDTSRIRIGTLVTNPLTRHPTVTAKRGLRRCRKSRAVAWCLALLGGIPRYGP